MLDANGFKVEKLTAQIVRKTKASSYYKKYRDSLEANKAALKVASYILENLYERELLVVSPPKILKDS